MLECFGYAPQIEMNIKDYRNMDIEPKGDGALNIHDDTHVIKYLQVKFWSRINTQWMGLCCA